jgi:hypothetical protein
MPTNDIVGHSTHRNMRGSLTAIMGSEAVDRVVSFGFLTDKATESIGGERVGGTTFFIHVSNVKLDRGVVLGSDETVGGRAIRRKRKNQYHPSAMLLTCIRHYHLRGM